MHLGDHLARGAQSLLLRVVGCRARQRAGLVRAVELQHVRAGAILELLRPFVRDHLAAREHDPQRREVVVVDRGRVQHHDELRRHRREHGDAVAARSRAARLPRRSARRRRTPRPRSPGEKCAVHNPKPNGVGRADRKTSSAVKCATRSANSWNANQRACVCITIFGSPVVPDVELRYQSSSAPIGCSAPASRQRAAVPVTTCARRCVRRGAPPRVRRRARRCPPRRVPPSRTRASPRARPGRRATAARSGRRASNSRSVAAIADDRSSYSAHVIDLARSGFDERDAVGVRPGRCGPRRPRSSSR